MNPLPIDIDELEYLHQKIGYAVWYIQDFENVLTHYLVMVHKLPIGTPVEIATNVLKKTKKGTLGFLMAEFKRSCEVKPDFEVRLDCFLDERNWLIHRSKNEERATVYNPDKSKLLKLFTRLEALAEEAIALTSEFGDLLTESLKKKGMDMEQVKREAQKLQEARIRGETPPEPF